MSIRHLNFLLCPASIAVFGASQRPGSVGATVWGNLRGGGFKGNLYPVNPKHRYLGDERAYASTKDLPQTPDLAVICTPPETVVGLIADLVQRGTRAAVVLTAGLSAAQKQAMLETARAGLLRILGPNCLGLLVPRLGLNASFSHLNALVGDLAFVSQSGALVTALLDWARGRGIGFSHFVSLGEHADVEFGDMLDFLATDPHTRAVLLYIESIEAARKFMSAARAAARNKPVIVVKAGRSACGQAAAASHTGALAGSDMVFDAAIRRAGMLRVDTLDELFLAAETLAHFRSQDHQRIRSLACPDDGPGRLTILTNGGGAGVMAADAAERFGVALTAIEQLSPRTRQQLDAVLPRHWSHANPVDIIGDAPVPRYVQALQALAQDEASGTMLFIHAPTAIVSSAEIARALLPVIQPISDRVMSCWLGDAAVAEARGLFREAGLASYATPEDAVQAFAMLQRYGQNQAQLLQAPALHAGEGVPSLTRAPDVQAVRAVVREVLAQGRELLSEPEAKAVLAAYGIAVVATHRVAAQPDAAVAAAQAIGYPVVLKIVSADISHKSDVGGVALRLDSDQAVRQAATHMLERIARLRPQARLEGFSVQAMVDVAHARELIVGASVDRVFGPVILFGQGGTAVEVLADRAIALPPLNPALARALIERTRVARLLAAYRDVPAVPSGAIEAVLLAVSQLVADVPELCELDINPLVASAEGVIALDGRIRVQSHARAGAQSFAICPYPVEMVSHLRWSGQSLTVRPIRPEDEAQHRRFLARMDPEDLRERYFHPVRRTMTPTALASLTQIDYDREWALIAEAMDDQGQLQTLGEIRALRDPEGYAAEFGVLVRSDLKGQRLGSLLVQQLLTHARARQIQQLEAVVLAHNQPMLTLLRHGGFTVRPCPQDPQLCEAVLALSATGTADEGERVKGVGLGV